MLNMQPSYIFKLRHYRKLMSLTKSDSGLALLSTHFYVISIIICTHTEHYPLNNTPVSFQEHCSGIPSLGLSGYIQKSFHCISYPIIHIKGSSVPSVENHVLTFQRKNTTLLIVKRSDTQG